MKICRTCGICCLKTEMILSNEDIERISHQLDGLSTGCFYEKKEDFFFLKNVDNHCFFFDPLKNHCRIYDFRPEGCRFYPMVFELDSNTCFLDEDCPHRKIFYSNPKSFKSNCLKLKGWLFKHILIKK